MSSHQSDGFVDSYDTPTSLRLSSFETNDGEINGGRRRWNELHERIIKNFYAPGSRVLVNPLDPNWHRYHLEEIGMASRSRRSISVEDQAKSLSEVLNDDPDFLQLRLEKWASFSKPQREDFIIDVLASIARSREKLGSQGGRCEFANNRNLIPEVTLKKLCSNCEQLADFFRLISTHVMEPANLKTHPFPNEQVFHRLGISGSTNFPLSMADRAFQEEAILRRHSLMFGVCETILKRLIPTDALRLPFELTFATWPSEVTYANSAYLSDKCPDQTKSEILKQFPSRVSEESCSRCRLTGAEPSSSNTALSLILLDPPASLLGLPRLLFCARCKKVNRIQPYCSPECQRADWKNHKNSGHCGSRFGTFALPPLITSDPILAPPASTAERRFVVNTLNRDPEAVWVFKHSSETTYTRFVTSSIGPLKQRVTSDLRACAYEALRFAHQPSIDVLAYVIIQDPLDYWLILPPVSSSKEDSIKVAKARSFRIMFDLVDETEWRSSLERGKAEVDLNPARAFINEYNKILRADLDQVRNKLVDLDVKDMPNPDNLLDDDIIRSIRKMMCYELYGYTKEEVEEELERFNKLCGVTSTRIRRNREGSPEESVGNTGSEGEEGENEGSESSSSSEPSSGRIEELKDDEEKTEKGKVEGEELA